MIKISRNIVRYTSLVVVVSMLTCGLAFASYHDHQADWSGAHVLADSEAALTVGGSEDPCLIFGLSLIAIGMSGLAGIPESTTLIVLGIFLLTCSCSC